MLRKGREIGRCGWVDPLNALLGFYFIRSLDGRWKQSAADMGLGPQP